MRNYSKAWINGSTNHRTSNIIDHANSEQHRAAINMLHRDEAKASNQPLQSYAPVVKALLTLDEGEKLKVMRKFDISYMLAREGIAFKKYTQIQALEMRHGVQLGSSYK